MSKVDFLEYLPHRKLGTAALRALAWAAIYVVRGASFSDTDSRDCKDNL